MGFQEITHKIRTNYSEQELRKEIAKRLKIKDFDYELIGKSLDARNKRRIIWQLRIRVFSDELKGHFDTKEKLEVPFTDRDQRVCVVGSGPAGFFAAFVLQKAGYKTTLIERGTDVNKRTKGIDEFEKSGKFSPISNYAFGEGGAGTFSDGKLTSRSKHISLERQFILNAYIDAGAPKEIAYMAHPHLGSDNLKLIVKKLRQQYEELGGKILFETLMTDVKVTNSKVNKVITDKGEIDTDILFIAPGHSAFETYRMLIRNGVQFRNKNFAIGSRMEHPQQIINYTQWGVEKLEGVKAAEYRLTSKGTGNQQIYTFCMCPGGMIVPATAYEDTNIVNGMSLYQRDAQYANAACVSGTHINDLLKKEVSPLESLEWLEQLERSFYELSKDYTAPFCSISDFIKQKLKNTVNQHTSYPLGITALPLWELLPQDISSAMQAGLKDFCRRLRGFDQGIIMGLESKTSAPIQVIREKDYKCTGFENLYIVGEGSGFAGGIVSSAADGIKAALSIL